MHSQCLAVAMIALSIRADSACAQTLNCRRTIRAENLPESICLSQTNQLLVTVGTSAVLYDKDGKKIAQFDKHASPLTCLKLSDDDTRIALGSGALTIPGELSIWDIRQKKKIYHLKFNENDIVSFIEFFAANQLAVVTRSGDNNISGKFHIIDLITSKSIVQPFTSDPISMAKSHDNKRLVLGHVNGAVTVWNTRSWERVAAFHADESIVGKVAISPNGEKLATLSPGKVIKLWRTSDSKRIGELTHSHPIHSVEMFPDGKRAITTDWAGGIKVWNLDPLKEIASAQAHEGWVTSISISHDGKRIATAGSDKVIKVWEFVEK